MELRSPWSPSSEKSRLVISGIVTSCDSAFDNFAVTPIAAPSPTVYVPRTVFGAGEVRVTTGRVSTGFGMTLTSTGAVASSNDG